MAHHVEPMDIYTDFDNKENSLHHNNFLPFPEKRYEELDISELSMKIKYSVTLTASPMSKSCTTNMMEKRNLDQASMPELPLNIPLPDKDDNDIELVMPSRGYSFNFDGENFDPFATNTTVRMSPPFESPNKPIEVKIQSKSVRKPTPKKLFKRQTQSDKKRNTASKRKSDMSLIKNTQSQSVNNSFSTCNVTENSENSAVPGFQREEEKVLKDKICNEVIELDTSNTTDSSKATDEINESKREVNTEYEDTIEDPFLEGKNLDLDGKISPTDRESLDMIQFDKLPTHTSEENLDNGEIFIDAEAFEFLLNQNKTNSVIDSGKESLILKFDPLFAKRISSITPDDVVASLTKLQNKQSTPYRLNRRSITFTSPAMAVIDRVLSVSNNSIDTIEPQVHREHNEADIALTQLRELLAEKEINVCNLSSENRDLRDRLNTLESHVKSLEAEGQDRLKKINQLNETLANKKKINRSMAALVEEYEKKIASLIANTAQDNTNHAEERIRLINEMNEQTAHLSIMEVSFNDLHSKYEKSKQIILNFKTNEEKYKKNIEEFEENLTKMQNIYEQLKQHATSKLNYANQKIEKTNRTHEAEVLKLSTIIKRQELDLTSLEESLIQKTKANKELTDICDELINLVG